MQREHHYQANIIWTGNKGSGTDSYLGYARSYTVNIDNKPEIQGSADDAFHGDKTKYNPEEMLLIALASCHMLWYLHLCSEAGVVVVEYTDRATGLMTETPSGNGKFESVTLNPIVVIRDQTKNEIAIELHKKANEFCFIANSVNFKVNHKPVFKLMK